MAKLKFGQKGWLGQQFRDDKGLFRGGEKGRLFGGFQDWHEGLNDPYKSQQDLEGGRGGYGTDLSRQFGVQDLRHLSKQTDLDQNVFAPGDPRLNQDFAGARTQALYIDPSNPNEVREMQKRLIEQGYLSGEKDPETGEYVQADAMFGPKTEAAMRQMQGHMPMSDPTGPEGLLGYTEMFGGGAGGGGSPTTKGQNYMTAGLNTLSNVPGIGALVPNLSAGGGGGGQTSQSSGMGVSSQDWNSMNAIQRQNLASQMGTTVESIQDSYDENR